MNRPHPRWPASSTGRLLAALGAGLLAAALVAGCSAGRSAGMGVLGAGGTSASATPGADSSSGSTSTPAPAPAPISASAVIDPVPHAPLRLVGSEVGHPSKGVDGGTVFTPRLAITTVSAGWVYAFDRSSGREVWSLRIPAVRLNKHDRDPTLCATPTPPPHATRMVVVVGVNCGRFEEIDLRTGQLEGHYTAGDIFGVDAGSQGLQQVGAYTYWVDSSSDLRRIDANGVSTPVVDPKGSPILGADFGAAPSSLTRVTHLIGGSYGDVLVVQTSKARFDLRPDEDSGRFFGLRLDATADVTTARRLWNEPVATTVRQAGHGADAKHLIAQTTFTGGHAFDADGEVYNVLSGSLNLPRLTAFDPSTGALDYRFLLHPHPVGGFPAWVVSDDLVPISTDQLLALNDAKLGHVDYAQSDDDGRSAVTAYDLEHNRIQWSYEPRLQAYREAPVARPVALSSDGSLVYVSVSSTAYTRLVALDRRTGRPVHSWTPTLYRGHLISDAVWAIQGRTVVLVDPENITYRGYRQILVYRFGRSG